MSHSSLWAITDQWEGEEHYTYSNSWLFCPIVWDVLLCKYIRPHERTDWGREVKHYMVWIGPFDRAEANRRWGILNDRINASPSQTDRVLWELSGLSVFNAKDKSFVADCVEAFVEENYVNNLEYQNADRIIARARAIAADIRGLPESAKYFVLKPTSCDDNVEYWFNNKQLCSWDKKVCEFTLIEDQRIVGFASNLEICKKED